MSISACDIKDSMLLSLLLASIKNLSWFFFLFLVVFNNPFVIPVVKENTIVNPAPAIPTGAPTTVVSEIIQTPPVVAIKTIKILSM